MVFAMQTKKMVVLDHSTPETSKKQSTNHPTCQRSILSGKLDFQDSFKRNQTNLSQIKSKGGSKFFQKFGKQLQLQQRDGRKNNRFEYFLCYLTKFCCNRSLVVISQLEVDPQCNGASLFIDLVLQVDGTKNRRERRGS